MKKVIVICGPTSSGKTALSIELAKKYQLEIINGDSVQVYKNYDIGSAKIKVNSIKNSYSIIMINFISSCPSYCIMMLHNSNKMQEPLSINNNLT